MIRSSAPLCPAGAPAGLQFLLQGLVASSFVWMTGFTPTVQATLV